MLTNGRRWDNKKWPGLISWKKTSNYLYPTIPIEKNKGLRAGERYFGWWVFACAGEGIFDWKNRSNPAPAWFSLGTKPINLWVQPARRKEWLILSLFRTGLMQPKRSNLHEVVREWCFLWLRLDRFIVWFKPMWRSIRMVFLLRWQRLT